MIAFASVLVALLAAVLHYRPQRPGLPKLALPKLAAGALSGYLVPFGVLAATISLRLDTPWSFLIGMLGAFVSSRYVRDVTASHHEIEKAFGSEWEHRVRPDVASRMLARRWSWWLPAARSARWHRDVPYWRLPGASRDLLCDIWQPPQGVTLSALAFIYLHGGYWHYFDKDSATRPLFRHLAGQGHVVMDVSYRLCPEVDLRGMMGDVAHAIAWMKQCGPEYGVDPRKIVIGGGSAGAHLAMLAAYAPGHPELTPHDLLGTDMSVRAIVSYYGPPDLRPLQVGPDANLAELDEGDLSGKTSNQPLTELVEAPRRVFAWRQRRSHEEMMRNLLGASYREVPEMYALASPITHVGPHCPPSLLFQGAHDSLVSVESARVLRERLLDAGVTVVYREFPMTEHAFDLILPQISPPAQSSIYDLDRFLAIMAS